MTPERLRQIEELYHEARQLEPDERGAFLSEACRGDEELRREVESLLAQEGQVGSFLEGSPLKNLEAQEAQVAAIPFGSDSAQSSLVGRQLGSYQVRAKIGEGGMGSVYQARDTKLGRDVAIKVLPATFARDAERLARFQREARVLASLNHPRIAAIYGMEESGGLHGLVMELVPGDTLADRGPLPLEKALTICRQIAEGLEEAHRKNITHRDIKPANIKVTPAGAVKILDFGLAKALVWEQSKVDLSELATASGVATEEGRILGTPAYMSPEQVRGQTVDKQTDIWSFGCVLYELLTGKPAFHRETLTDTIAAVLDREPDWQALRPATPAAVRDLLQRCLQKERNNRLHDIADARIEINEATRDPQVNAIDGRSRRRERLAWAVAALATLIAVGQTIWPRRLPSIMAPEVRLEITTPPTTDPVSLAISPDGQKIVFVATSDGRPRLWLRSLNSVLAHPMAATDGGFGPFWSPDNRSVGFFADGQLKRIDIDGGLVRALANAPNPFGGAWSHDGMILFAPNATGPIFRVSASGGEPAALTRIEAKQAGHGFPQFLPDGHHFLYYVTGSAEASGIYVGEVGGTTMPRLLDADAAGVYTSVGQLLFVRQSAVFGQDFDPVSLTLSGNPFSISERVAVDGITNSPALSASTAGPIVYRTGSLRGQRQFVWFDRSGKELGTVGEPDRFAPSSPEISPDGQRLAMYRTVNGNLDVWMLDIARGALSRSTLDPASEANPVWSPDGRRILFNSNRDGLFDLYLKPATGDGNEELLLATQQNKAPSDWSRDGRFVLFRSPNTKTGFDLWVLPMSGSSQGDRKPFPVVQTNFEERDGQFSPDGRWIAYQSNESGRPEIYVQPFPGPGGKFQISTSGGAQVRWRADGKELYYIGLDGRLMATPIHPAPNGQNVDAGTPLPLFTTRVGGAILGTHRQQYDVSPDGQRFLMNTISEEAPSPITVILNWKAKP